MNPSEAGKNPPLRQNSENATKLIREWRSELASDEGPRKLEISASELEQLLDESKVIELDPALTLFVIMGTEWLFRARLKASEEDIRHELRKIQSSLCRGVRPIFEPYQAELLVRGIAPSVSKTLRAARYLISLKQWAFSSRWTGWSPLSDTGGGTVRFAVPKKRGQIPNIGPKLAGVILAELAEKVPGENGREFGARVSSCLLLREVKPYELAGWSKKLEESLPSENLQLNPGDTQEPDSAPEPKTYKEWLVRKCRRGWEIAYNDRRTAGDFLERAEYSPEKEFSLLVDLNIISELYSMPWSNPKHEL